MQASLEMAPSRRSLGLPASIIMPANATHFSIAAVVVGILLRIIEWGRGRSLWVDEAMLAINILERDFVGLLKPLRYDQGAPYGFLYAVKSAVLLFGNNEWALRLVPLISGVLSLILFYKLSRMLLNPIPAFFSILLFSMMGTLIYYSAETKQYSSDVLLTVTMLLMFGSIEQKGWTWKRTLAIALVGSIGIWFSHPIIFVLAGMGLSQLFFLLRRRDFKETIFIVFCGVLWLSNFALFYISSLQTTAGNSILISYWAQQDAFMPLTEKLPQWFAFNFTYLLFRQIPLLTFLFPVTAVLWFVGMHQMWRRSKREFWPCTSIILLALVASALQKYPFKGRFILFLSPILIIAIARGLSSIPLIRIRILRGAAYTLAGAMVFATIYGAFNTEILCRKRGVNKMIEYVAANSLEGDFICPWVNSKLMKYYADRSLWPKWPEKPDPEKGHILGANSNIPEIFDGITRVAPSQRNYRLWVVTGSHRGKDDPRVVVDKFDEIAERLDYQKHEGACLYLYAVSNSGLRKIMRTEIAEQ